MIRPRAHSDGRAFLMPLLWTIVLIATALAFGCGAKPRAKAEPGRVAIPDEALGMQDAAARVDVRLEAIGEDAGKIRVALVEPTTRPVALVETAERIEVYAALSRKDLQTYTGLLAQSQKRARDLDDDWRQRVDELASRHRAELSAAEQERAKIAAHWGYRVGRYVDTWLWWIATIGISAWILLQFLAVVFGAISPAGWGMTVARFILNGLPLSHFGSMWLRKAAP